MTILKGKLTSVGGKPFAGSGYAVLIYSCVTRTGPDNTVILRIEDIIPMTAAAGGQFTSLDMPPGPIRVELRGGDVHGQSWDVNLPDEETVELSSLVEAQVEWAPDVVSRAEEAARRAEDAWGDIVQVTESTEWQGDRLRIHGRLSPPLTGPMPDLTISGSGTWVINGQDTGAPARGPIGDLPPEKEAIVRQGASVAAAWGGQAMMWAQHADAAATRSDASAVDAVAAEASIAGIIEDLAEDLPPHSHPVGELDATGTRSASTFLRGDGSWSTPPDTKYSVPTQAEAQAGTATTGRAFSAQRVAQAIDHRAAPKNHSHTLQQVTGLDDALGGKAPMPVEVTGDNWPTTGVPGTIFWKEEES